MPMTGRHGLIDLSSLGPVKPRGVTQYAQEAPSLRCGKIEHGESTLGIGASNVRVPWAVSSRVDDATDRLTDRRRLSSECDVSYSSLERLSAKTSQWGGKGGLLFSFSPSLSQQCCPTP